MLKLSEKANEQTGAAILLEAMSNDKIHLARFILDALDGKIINARTERAQTPLMSSVLLADTHMSSKFMKLLLQRGADVNCQDESGRTALSYACERGHLEAVKTLVQNNADPELVDMWGNTALIYAAVAGHTSVVAFLVRAFKRMGLEIDRPNRVGNSAVEVAKFLGHKECFLALTSHTKKSHDKEIDVLPQSPFKKHVLEDKYSRKFSEQVNFKHINSPVCPPIEPRCAITANENERADVSDRKRSQSVRHRLTSMASIDETEKESEGALQSPRLDVYNGLSVRPRVRSWSVQYSNQKLQEKTNNVHLHLPHLPAASDLQISTLHSPRPNKNTPNSSAPNRVHTSVSTSTLWSSPLGILLTPIAAAKTGEDQVQIEKLKQSDLDTGVRRFDDSYYQKRCSLPTSTLHPAPPERWLLPLRKPKSGQKNGHQGSPSPTAPIASTTFTGLGNKLFRRFTFPEFRKVDKDQQEDRCADASVSSPDLLARGMSRSETYPFSKKHPQVGSKPSIDSISAVKCEFDFPFKSTAS
ncbi:uncharacterized protein LOC136759116 [Amia ocellicauda]|uniref:uncharacterized protein LOC136759116 n=1 Tax=Amia ocellicauda TaxID=2972642 RepID=UPI0034639349